MKSRLANGAIVLLTFVGCSNAPAQTNTEVAGGDPATSEADTPSEGAASPNAAQGGKSSPSDASAGDRSSPEESPGPARPGGRQVRKGPTTSEWKVIQERCRRESDATTTRAEFDAAGKRCEAAYEEANSRGDDTIAGEGDREIVSEAELRAWWPYRPLLASPSSPPPVFAAFGWDGGRATDARSSSAEAQVLYEGETSVYDANLPEFYKAGGVLVVAQSPAGTGFPPHGGPSKPVRVRGRDGQLHTIAMEDGVEVRAIVWEAPVSGNPDLAMFAVLSSTERYSEEQSLRFADSLSEST